jgi:ERF superfamily
MNDIKPLSMPIPQPTTPMEMLARAVNSGASPETLEKFMAMAERWEANQARRLYDKAIAAAKAEIKPVIKNKTASRGNAGTYKYADMAAVELAVVPALSANGLSYRFRTSVDDKSITVTCILGHEGGHSEETSLRGPADVSGAKNAIQALGSTVTYLQRYTLMAALGLSASVDDDGGLSSDSFGDTISDEQIDELSALLDVIGRTEGEYCTYKKLPSLSRIRQGQFQSIKNELEGWASK